VSSVTVPSIRGGIVEKFRDSDRLTYTVGAGQVATGGLLVEAVTGVDRQVKLAAAASVRCQGVAMHDGVPGDSVTVAAAGVFMLTASGAIVAGDRLICAAAGQVSAAGATPDARTVIGRALADIANAAQGPCAILLA